jgi:hypothetical protein
MIFLLSCTLGTRYAACEEGMNAEELLTRHLEAVGGEQKVRSVLSIDATGTVFDRYDYGFKWKSPNRVRQEFPGGTLGYDGTEAWRLVFGLPASLEDERRDDLIKLAVDTGLWFGLLDAEKRNQKLEFLGEKRTGPQKHWVLRYRIAENEYTDAYFSKDDYLLEKTIEVAPSEQYGTTKLATTYSDFREIDGVKFPFGITTQQLTTPENRPNAVIFKEVTFNATLHDSLFARPAFDIAPPKKHGHCIDGTVLRISLGGSLICNIKREDFEMCEIAEGDSIDVSVGEHSWRAEYNNDVSSIGRGSRIAIFYDGDFLWIAEPGRNIAQELDVKPSDKIGLERVES